MQPEPSGSSVRPSNGGSTVLQGESSNRFKRKACEDDSRKKFLKVSAGVVASPHTAYRRHDVSDVSNTVKTVNGATSDSALIAFKHGTVKDEKIYLDLKDGKLTQDLEKYIIRFGGIVEKFLSKDITCVITSHINPDNIKAEDAVLKKEAFSPSTAEKPKPDICSSLGAMSRGKTLLLRSNSMKASSAVCGPVQFARTWKIPVAEVSVLRKLLKTENNHRKQVSSQSSKMSVKKLDKPFVKVEDTLQMYSTNFRLFNTFPMSYLSSVDSLPCNEASQSNESVVKKKPKQTRIKNSGYCECCDVSFTNQKEHFKCRVHKAFVTRNENFASLDALVSKLPSLEKFALAVELGAKNLSSSGAVTGIDPGLVHGLSDSQVQDHSLKPSAGHAATVHGTKRLHPVSSTNLKLDVNNLRAGTQSSKCGILPATFFTPDSSCPIRKPKSKKSQNNSSKSYALDSVASHIYEKCDGDRNLMRANYRHAARLLNKDRLPNKISQSDFNVDLNCPVDLSLPKSSAGVSSYHSPLVSSCLLTVSESNVASATVSNTKISRVNKALKTDNDAYQKQLIKSKCSATVSDISGPKLTTDKVNSERIDISMDTKLLKAPAVTNNAELRSPFMGNVIAVSKDNGKDDDLEFSSDEVSDCADEKIDWRITLRNSCNKVLNILEDSNSSKDLTKDVPGDCVNNLQISPSLTDVQLTQTCYEVISEKKVFNFSNLENLTVPGCEKQALRIQPGLDETEKTTTGKVSSKAISVSSKVKNGGVGIVRPWEIVSNKHEPNQSYIDKESHCNNVGCQVQGNTSSSGCVLQTDSQKCLGSNTVHRQVRSIENHAFAENGVLPEATHSYEGSNMQTTKSTEGNTGNPELTNSNEGSNQGATYLAEGSNQKKTTSTEGSAEPDFCAGENAALTAVSCQFPDKSLHSPAAVEVHVSEQSLKVVAAERMATANAESLAQFQNSSPSSSRSSVIVDVEAFDDRSDNSEEKGQTPIPTYEAITPVKPHMPPCLEMGERGFGFSSKYQVFDQRVVGQLSSWPITPVLVNGQIVYLPTNVMDIPGSPTVSQQPIGMGLTNCQTANEFLSAGNRELHIQKQDSACSSLDSGFSASVKTVTAESHPGSPVENCAESTEEGDTRICDLKSIPSQTENPLSSPVPIPAERHDSLPVTDQAENNDACTTANLIHSPVPIQSKTTDYVPLHGQSKHQTSVEVLVAPRSPSSISVPPQAENSDKLNLPFQAENTGSLAASVQTKNFPLVSSPANNDSLPVIGQAENNNLLLVCGKTSLHENSQLLTRDENSDSLSVLVQNENTDLLPVANQEEKLDFCAAVSSADKHSYSSGDGKRQINNASMDEVEFKDVSLSDTSSIHPPLRKSEDKTADAVEDLMCPVVQVPESSNVAAVPEVQTYPDLMSGIDELPDKAKTQIPDLLMEAKSDATVDSPCLSNCPLVPAEDHHTVSEALPHGINSSGSEPMDVGFGELSEDFFIAKSNPVTLFGTDKTAEMPWIDNSWDSANHPVESAATLDTWPEELATIVQSRCPNDLSPVCYDGLDSLAMSAPIGTPNCISFGEDESKVPASKNDPASGVSWEPQTEILSTTDSMSSAAEPSVLDDDVLTALLKILEDASKEWQAERQKSSSTEGGAVMCPLLSVCVADNDLKQVMCNKISESHATNVEISSLPVIQTTKPITAVELQSFGTDEPRRDSFSKAVCSVRQNNLPENILSCSDVAQPDGKPVAQTLQLCTDDAKKEMDEQFSTASAPDAELDDLDKLMEMLKALNEETKYNNETVLTSCCSSAATSSCRTATKGNSSELVVDLPNDFCDSFGGISFPSTRKMFSKAAATGNSVQLLTGSSSNFTTNHFSDFNGRVCKFEDKDIGKIRYSWKMTHISSLKFLFQRLPQSPGCLHSFKNYSIKNLGNKTLTVCISKKKSKSSVKS